jgi:hypothetical protein
VIHDHSIQRTARAPSADREDPHVTGVGRRPEAGDLANLKLVASLRCLRVFGFLCDPNDMPRSGFGVADNALSDWRRDASVVQLTERILFVQSGRRIRAALTWHACPPDMYQTSIAPAAVATDFDLLLHTEMNGGEYVYMSQSLDDSTEGFDVVVSDSARYTIYIAWPEGNQGCELNEQEGVGWAWAISKQ